MKTGPIKVDIRELYNEMAYTMSHATGSVEGAYDADKFTDKQIAGCINVVRQYVAALNECSEDVLTKRMDECIKKELRKQETAFANSFDKRERNDVRKHNQQMRSKAKGKYI